MNHSKLYSTLALIVAIFFLVGSASHFVKRNNLTLSDWESLTSARQETLEEEPQNKDNTEITVMEKETVDENTTETEDDLTKNGTLTGAFLNRSCPKNQRFTYADGFYCEPITSSLAYYLTGSGISSSDASSFSMEELRYLHILHYNFEGEKTQGELICHQSIVQDLFDIFYLLYQNEYQLESVLLPEEYENSLLQMQENNNSFCFYSGEDEEGKHNTGFSIDINPKYNPILAFEKDGSMAITPAAASSYADRNQPFPYKIDENDLCYKLFTQRGFLWGGNWNDHKEYSHFQKVLH